MILARNHRQLLSGNKLLFFFGCILLAACSPKIQPKKENKEVVKKDRTEDIKPENKFSEAKISLLIPFRLNEIDLKSANRASIEKAAMAIDFYQGFKMGIDSAAASGLNFKLNVFDTRDDNAHIASLYKNPAFNSSMLVVGPVFPDGLKYITNYSIENKQLIVSPLAASQPSEFNNPNLISIVNNIDLHAEKIGKHIYNNYDPDKTMVVIINPKRAEDELLAQPVRDFFKREKVKSFTVQEYPSVAAMETKMIRDRKYVVIIASSNRSFVLPSIDRLVKLHNLKTGGYSIDLVGHPNWIKQSYSTDKLQQLNTVITASYFVDYKSPAVISFVKKYRAKFNFEPGEYSFKGFDIGYYFGTLIARYGMDYRKHITKTSYLGLQNSFSFIYNEKLGFINTDLMLLRYKNFSLRVEE